MAVMSLVRLGAPEVMVSRGMRQFLFLLLSFVLVFSSAMKAADAQSSFRFNQIIVEGNQRIETGTVLSVLDLSTGQSYNAAEVNAAGQRVRDTGYFETVDVEAVGNSLVISVDEYPTINRISIEGNRRLSDEELLFVIGSEERRVFSPQQAERDTDAIARAYSESGRISAEVTPRIIRRSDNRVDLVFEVFEGGLTEIERIAFVGNRSYSDRVLRGALETRQAGFFRQIIGSDTYSSERILQDQRRLTDFYRARGFIDFRITGVTTELSPSREAFFLTFQMEEGQRWRIRSARPVSLVPGIDPALFERAVRIRSGTLYSPLTIDNTIARMERLAIQEGLRFIQVTPKITRSERDLTLDIDFQIERGPRVFIERINIEGNTTTLDRVIRRQFRSVEGDPFNPREIEQSADRIRALNYFGNVQVRPREGSAPDQRIIDVNVEEQPTGSISFGANYSTDDGIGFIASLRERNFLGRGQRVGVSISTGRNDQQIGLNFTEPAFLGRDVSASIALSYRVTDSEYALYDTRSWRIRPSLGFPVGEYSRLTLSYELKSTDIFDVNTTTQIIQDEAERGEVLSSALGYSFSYDTRRGGLNPDAGILLRFGQEFGGVGGDISFVDTSLLAVAQRKVRQGDVTLRAVLEGGAQYYFDKDSRVTDRYFISSNRMRGFEPGGIGPREINNEDNDALGGLYYSVARFEAEFPIGLPPEYGISGGLFYDIGSVWGLDNTNSDVVGEEFSLRQVIGASVFWDTALGPLRFNWSRAIKKEDFDEDRVFDVTVSTSF